MTRLKRMLERFTPNIDEAGKGFIGTLVQDMSDVQGNVIFKGTTVKVRVLDKNKFVNPNTVSLKIDSPDGISVVQDFNSAREANKLFKQDIRKFLK